MMLIITMQKVNKLVKTKLQLIDGKKQMKCVTLGHKKNTVTRADNQNRV